MLWVALAVLAFLIIAGGIGAALGGEGAEEASVVSGTAATDRPVETTAMRPSTTAAPTTTAAPATTAPPTTLAPTTTVPPESVSQRNARRQAESYLKFMAFSRSGLINQLEFEGFSVDDATYAVDNVRVDWFQQAAKKAASYLDMMPFSRSGLVDQLLFEGFTQAEAEFGVNSTGL